jgi:hypothetical protein
MAVDDKVRCTLDTQSPALILVNFYQFVNLCALAQDKRLLIENTLITLSVSRAGVRGAKDMANLVLGGRGERIEKDVTGRIFLFGQRLRGLAAVWTIRVCYFDDGVAAAAYSQGPGKGEGLSPFQNLLFVVTPGDILAVVRKDIAHDETGGVRYIIDGAANGIDFIYSFDNRRLE